MRAIALKWLPGLDPVRFWMYTPAELGEVLEGAVWRERSKRELLAWQTAHTLNIAGKVLKRDVQLPKLMREIWDPHGAENDKKVTDPGAKFERLWAKVEDQRRGIG